MNLKTTADKLYSKLEKKEDGYYKPRKVYPIIDEDGTINWFNFLTGGSWKSLLVVIFILLVSLGFIYEYHSNLQTCAKYMSDYNLGRNLSINYSDISPVQEGLKLVPNWTRYKEGLNES
jgi:hypothetical protein